MPLEQHPYLIDFQLSYSGETIGSVDIMGALGSYDASSMNFAGFRVWDRLFNNPENLVANFDFDRLTIALPTDAVISDGFED